MKIRSTFVRTLLYCMCAATLLATKPANAVDIAKCSMVASGEAQIISFGAKQSDGRVVTLKGIVTFPEGRKAPYPAVVMLPGGGGLLTPYCYEVWVNRFRSWGFATLIVASTTAHDADQENLSTYSFLDQANHARAATSHFASMAKIDRTHISIWGFSRGGLTAIELAAGTQQDVGRFRAVIAAAPYCPANVIRPHTPLFVLIGDEDERLSVSSCIEYAAKLKQFAEFEFLLLNGAKHVFWMDSAAAELSARRMQAFLRRYLQR